MLKRMIKKRTITPVGEVGDVSGGPRVEDCQGDLLDGAPGVPDGALEHGVEGEYHEDVPPPLVHGGPLLAHLQCKDISGLSREEVLPTEYRTYFDIPDL